MTLQTVADYVAEARVLLQDQVVDYRYADAEILSALNMAFLEARRLRPDMFMLTPTVIPSYSTVNATVVAIDPQYAMSLLYYIVGMMNLRDQEDSQDQRASALMAKFVAQLLSINS